MSTKRHLVKVMGLAVMAALAISAFASASASATPKWTVEGVGLGEGTSKGIKAHAVLKTGSTAKLEGEILGQKFKLTATTLSSKNGTIFQEATKAKDSGILVFSGLSVDEPVGCGVESPIETKALTSELVEHSGSTRAYDKFFPEEGEVFATVKVTGCAVAGSYNVKGFVFGQAEEWGKELTKQPLLFNPEINETLKGSLTLGVKPAKLFAEGVNTLESEQGFSADK
jgi:hypothetical protein